MNLILVLLAFFPRPELAPIGPAEVSAARKLEVEAATTSVKAQSRQDYAGRSAWSSPTASRVPGRFVVGFETGGAAAALEWISQHDGSLVRVDSGLGFAVADFPNCDASPSGPLAASASQTSGIRYFEPDIRVFAAALPNDPYFVPYQWDKWVMYADEAWDITGGSMDVKVAVVDEGVDYTHPDLAGDFKSGDLGYDFIGNDADPKPDDPSIGEAFHGTHVAGIIAATRNNNVGIAGWSLCQLLAVRVLSDSGSGSTSVVAQGIKWAADQGARVINMSLTSSAPSTPLEDACSYAAQAGVLLIAASGNDGAEAIGYPAAYGQCIAIGATSADSHLALFSNYGAEQELVAPGTSILSCFPGGQYGWADGTSMAAPQVAGVAALVLARNYGLSATQVRAILDASAIDMGTAGRDVQYGYGLVNAKRALDLAATYSTSRRVQSSESRIQSTEFSTTIVRAGTSLPMWIQQAEVFDGSGRLVSAGRSGLRPGTYFVMVSPKDERQRTKDEGQGTKSSVVRRLLVLD
ncbi:MAG TPA: S8 family peptidase [bacterium]|nr:S8 family peptidase [bacterium]